MRVFLFSLCLLLLLDMIIIVTWCCLPLLIGLWPSTNGWPYCENGSSTVMEIAGNARVQIINVTGNTRNVVGMSATSPLSTHLIFMAILVFHSYLFFQGENWNFTQSLLLQRIAWLLVVASVWVCVQKNKYFYPRKLINDWRQKPFFQTTEHEDCLATLWLAHLACDSKNADCV